jgi:5'-deoxynucleotidase YfbR-like HD superfamily hydrolase
MNIVKEIEQLQVMAMDGISDIDFAQELNMLLSKFYEQKEKAKKAWIMTYTGKHLHAFDPKFDQICIVDIAHALSKNNRFTGHCFYNYTVGQHSLYVYKVLRDLGCDKTTLLMGLLHDASEAYIQDIAKPFKEFLFDYQELEELLQDMIYMKYLGFIPTKEQYAIVKYADEILLFNEIKQLMPKDNDWNIPDDIDIKVEINKKMAQEDIFQAFVEYARQLGVND